MNPSKNTIRTLIVLAIVLVLYCVLAFVIPFSRGAVFWLSFVFGLIAICAQVYVLKTAFDKGESVRSKFYGYPVARIGLIYLAAQLVLSFLFMALGRFIPAWVAVLVFLLLLGFAAIGFIAADAIRDEVERQDTQLVKDVSAMRALQSRSAAVAAQCDDPAAKAALNGLAEKLRFSDPVSSDATAEAEADLAALLDELQRAVVDKDPRSASALAAKAEAVLAERNRLCKLNK